MSGPLLMALLISLQSTPPWERDGRFPSHILLTECSNGS